MKLFRPAAVILAAALTASPAMAYTPSPEDRICYIAELENYASFLKGVIFGMMLADAHYEQMPMDPGLELIPTEVEEEVTTIPAYRP